MFEPNGFKCVYADRNRMPDNFYALCQFDVDIQNRIEVMLWIAPAKDQINICVAPPEALKDERASAINAARICNKWDTNGWTYVAT